MKIVSKIFCYIIYCTQYSNGALLKSEIFVYLGCKSPYKKKTMPGLLHNYLFEYLICKHKCITLFTQESVAVVSNFTNASNFSLKYMNVFQCRVYFDT